MNGGFDPRKGMFIGSALGKAMWQAVKGPQGRLWYGNGWLWLHDHGHVTRLQHMEVDFGGIARFDVDKSVLRHVRNDDYLLLTPAKLARYDMFDDCQAASTNVPQQAVYRWEQYINPAVTRTIGYSYVELTGTAVAADVLKEAVPGRKCGFTCEQVDERHNVVRMLTQNDEWKAESVIFAEDDIGYGGR